MTSAIYVGRLRHRRRTPVAHAFTYPIFMALLDVDRLPELMGVSRFTSLNRWNWAAFDDRDHLPDLPGTLRERLEADAARQGVPLGAGPIYLLTHLRYLGYCFNPISFFYCLDANGALSAVLAEVNNTFGGSHRYWLTGARTGAPPVTGGRDDLARTMTREARSHLFRATADKRMAVSPFMDLDLGYRFALTPPDDRLVAHIEVVRGAAPFFDATLTLERRGWDAATIRRTLAAHPWMTAKVVTAIHWEALRLWWKGVPVVPRPTPDGVLR